MRFEDFLIGKYNEKKIYEEIWDTLVRDCKPFLKELKGSNKLIWRGSLVPNEDMRTLEHDLIRKDAHKYDDRNDRRPRAFPNAGHYLLNKVSNTVHGWKYRNGVMTTPNEDHAREFGAVRMFFPIGSYQYLWHPKIKDLNMFDVHIHGKATQEFKGDSDIEWYGPADVLWRWFNMYQKKYEDAYLSPQRYFRENPKEEERIIKLLKLDTFVGEYRNNNIQEGIRKGSEIIFNCEEYYLVHRYWKQGIIEKLQ